MRVTSTTAPAPNSLSAAVHLSDRILSGLPFWTTNILSWILHTALCLPRGELKEKISSMVAERFQTHSDLKTEAQKMLNSYLAVSRLVWRVEMGAGNWAAQDQTLRLSWVRLLDYFFTPKPRPLRPCR
jgi:hypothetical protein